MITIVLLAVIMTDDSTAVPPWDFEAKMTVKEEGNKPQPNKTYMIVEGVVRQAWLDSDFAGYKNVLQLRVQQSDGKWMIHRFPWNPETCCLNEIVQKADTNPQAIVSICNSEQLNCRLYLDTEIHGGVAGLHLFGHKPTFHNLEQSSASVQRSPIYRQPVQMYQQYQQPPVRYYYPSSRTVCIGGG